MTTLVLEQDPVAVNVAFSADELMVDLADGRKLFVPLSWYPRLAHAKKAEREKWQLLGDGYAIEWPDLDEYVGIAGLVAGRRSGECAESLERWQASRIH